MFSLPEEVLSVVPEPVVPVLPDAAVPAFADASVPLFPDAALPLLPAALPVSVLPSDDASGVPLSAVFSVSPDSPF